MASAVSELVGLLGGDFQMFPSDIEVTLFQEAAGARVVADITAAGTCTSAYGISTINYFVMCDGPADAAGSAQVRLDATVATHRPVQITLPANAGKMKKRVIVAVQKLPNDPVFGPRPPPTSWTAGAALA